MIIENLLIACDQRLKNNRHGKPCPNDGINNGCESCLHSIHFPTEDSPQKKYDCVHMADYYVCKYTYKYTSELIYAFDQLSDLLKRSEHLNVLSFGCGPCTDLLALDFLRHTKKFSYSSISFRGIDYNTSNVWNKVHADIMRIKNQSTDITFEYRDACEIINDLVETTWIPDIVTFQYFFSDMGKNTEPSAINEFLCKLATFANNNMREHSYIVLNDINLSTTYPSGCREYFNKLFECLHKGRFIMDFGYFHNDSQPHTYAYGHKFENNTLFFKTNSMAMYNPPSNCSSAQMLIKKDGKTT
ncbi:MAG: hypothetical protein LBH93_06505 [Chitinispirillales bacterium]|jgi:hypothetical protein|nr:hypothetical protein [Chitinispirillales bacterium]